MPFEVGDKVKFLNEKGGGIITKVLPNQMVEAIDTLFTPVALQYDPFAPNR